MKTTTKIEIQKFQINLIKEILISEGFTKKEIKKNKLIEKYIKDIIENHLINL